jgi:hypothetical protein
MAVVHYCIKREVAAALLVYENVNMVVYSELNKVVVSD